MVDNYKEINAEAEIKNSQSIFHFYKRMIAFRQKSPIQTSYFMEHLRVCQIFQIMLLLINAN